MSIGYNHRSVYGATVAKLPSLVYSAVNNLRIGLHCSTKVPSSVQSTVNNLRFTLQYGPKVSAARIIRV